MNNRSTSIRLGDFESSVKKIDIGILQGSPISLILYLFYNADLLDDYYDISISTDPIGFVDDINILTYSKSLERNYIYIYYSLLRCSPLSRSMRSRLD